MITSADASAQAPRPERIADRYTVLDTLGRGGMACVYRAQDSTTGGHLALKQLHFAQDDVERASVTALFEREFHTLSQLSHPRVIAVYDFGVDPASGPYYTMELLDGGDLRARAPLPWRDACTLLFDVCSSLALLHSRRLLHRDISPRNIRCTRDGKAKLIDFGAMAPIGPGGGPIVGTPAFTPPESLHHSALDARTDLLALGASLYYALTGAMAYPARNFAEVLVAWSSPLAPPSARVPGIPAALDHLVMSLLSLEPALRPPSAFEVMQRLAAIADLPCVEPAGVARAYLTTPVLVGRDATLADVRDRLTRSLVGRGGGVIIGGAPGVGRSRMLDACALEAKTLGATVLRATASGTEEPYAVALALTRHVIETVPNAELAGRFPELFEQVDLLGGELPGYDRTRAAPKLKSVADLRSDPERLQRAICGFILALAKTQPLVVAVDDAHRIDEPSAAVLAELVDNARRARILVALTAETQATGPTPALHVLAGRCVALSLEPLDDAQTQALLGSLFGDVANLELVAHEVFKLARGNPRQSMDVAQHLVDRGSIEYRAGRWTLPSALSSADLPSSAEDAIRTRLETLSPLARLLGEAHALAFLGVWAHDDYRRLCAERDPRAIDAAIAELLSQQALTLDGAAYTLANRVWAEAFKAGLAPLERVERHRVLAELYRGRSNLALVHHLFAAGLDEQGLDALIVMQERFAENFDLKAVLEMNATNLGPSFVRSLQTAERLKRPARQLHEVRRWLLALSVASDAAYYYRTAPAWLEQLKLDSGLSFWLQDAQNTDAGARITNALQRANERYLAAPEPERVYTVEEAIRYLAQFVAFSIAIGSRTIDTALLSSLPGLLEPFAIFSPVIEAIRQNSMATGESNRDARYESARVRWMGVHDKLGEITGTELQHVETIRNAVAYAVGLVEATLGLASAADWAARIDHDPMQRLSALYLRKIVRLQQGDWDGADRLARQAEILSLQARAPQMFTTLLVVELSVQVQARNLVGVKEVIARIAPLAAQHPGWRSHLRVAEASFELIRGDLAAAKRGFEGCIEMSELNGDPSSRTMAAWMGARAGLAEVLLSLGQVEEARECARAAVATCDALQIRGGAHELRRMLALAEAKLGDFAAAIGRLDSVIEEQVALGVSGLKLGLTYEARAQVAIWGGDVAGFERFAQWTAREYRHGAKCPLSARYERLVQEARRCGFAAPLPGSSELAATTVDSGRVALQDVRAMVSRALTGVLGTQERAQRALELVCEACAARGGHFYLTSREGLVLAASRGSPPSADLERLAREHLARELANSEVLTRVTATSSSSATSDTNASTRAEAEGYELLLVAGVGNQETQVAGVIALAFGKARIREAQRAQLLTAIATELQASSPGDCESGDAS
jgi:hypothetical protein